MEMSTDPGDRTITEWRIGGRGRGADATDHATMNPVCQPTASRRPYHR